MGVISLPYQFLYSLKSIAMAWDMHASNFCMDAKNFWSISDLKLTLGTANKANQLTRTRGITLLETIYLRPPLN